MTKVNRLPVSFHMSFQPERHYLSSLLSFAQKCTIASIDEISERTGIPTGKSTGKVRPLLQYAQGMGLLDVEALGKAGQVKLSLLPLGITVLREDPPLLEENTQWALHLMLCRKNGGAEVWHAVFVGAVDALGKRFSETQFDEFLANRFGSSRDPIGPLIRTYMDPTGLGKAAAIFQQDSSIEVRKVPVQPAMYDMVAALLFMAWDTEFPTNKQVALKELEGASCLMAATGWNSHEQAQFLAEMEQVGWVKVDRQTGDPILTRLINTHGILDVMYDRLP